MLHRWCNMIVIVDPARIPLFTYLCLITSLVFCFIHLRALPQSCSKTTMGCTTSCLHLCVFLLAPPPNLPAVSWLAESGLMVEVCMVPLCSLSQHKATVYLTCPHQCSACKLRIPQSWPPSDTWDQLHPSLFPLTLIINAREHAVTSQCADWT